MKKLFLLLSFLFVLSSCEIEGELTKDKINSNPISENSILKYSGIFAPTSGISAEGNVKIYLENNQYILKLENFSVSEGPDLKVYLSKSDSPVEFVNLGNLNPTATYKIPQGVDFTEFKYVLIHCQQYNHLFAIAQLTQN